MKKRILITDDTAFMRMSLRNVLEQHGYEVTAEAVDGAQAVEKYMEVKPDLVTMDITMPNMDGITAIKTIIAKDPAAKIVVVSAMGQKGLVMEALSAGASDFVVKPFQPERILESFKKVIG